MSTLISLRINPSVVTNTSPQPDDCRMDLLPGALFVNQGQQHGVCKARCMWPDITISCAITSTAGM